MTITGEFYERRPDLIGFVNGLPLVLVELKRNDVRPRTPTATTCATTRPPSRSSSGTTP
ncbi:MAG: type I restriction endonuclease [Thermomicrobiales bacterium]